MWRALLPGPALGASLVCHHSPKEATTATKTRTTTDDIDQVTAGRGTRSQHSVAAASSSPNTR
eukprot:12913293-Prorocentrum_lima.AAC.1